MARSVNHVILIGNLTRDPELRYTQSGKPVCDIGLATSRQWKTDTGEKKEETAEPKTRAGISDGIRRGANHRDRARWGLQHSRGRQIRQFAGFGLDGMA